MQRPSSTAVSTVNITSPPPGSKDAVPLGDLHVAFGTAIVRVLDDVVHDKVTIVRLGPGTLTKLGLRALLTACGKSTKVQVVELCGHDLSHPSFFESVVQLVQESRKLQVLVLEDAQLTDAHVTPLARIMRSASQSQLEHLSMASNRLSPAGGMLLCNAFCALPCARTLNLSHTRSLGDEFLAAQLEVLQRDGDLNLRCLDLAYSDVTCASLVDVIGLLRICPHLHLVISGSGKHLDEWKPVHDLEAQERLVILPECTSR